MVKDDPTTRKGEEASDETPREKGSKAGPKGTTRHVDVITTQRHSVHDIAPYPSKHLNEADCTESVSEKMATGAGIERVGSGSQRAAVTVAMCQVLHRIRGQIESGAYYEAQQSYKTVYHRYKAKDLHRESHTVLEVDRLDLCRSHVLHLIGRCIGGNVFAVGEPTDQWRDRTGKPVDPGRPLGCDRCASHGVNAIGQSYEEGLVELNETGMAALRKIVELLPRSTLFPELHQDRAEVEEGIRFLENGIRFLKK